MLPEAVRGNAGDEEAILRKQENQTKVHVRWGIQAKSKREGHKRFSPPFCTVSCQVHNIRRGCRDAMSHRNLWHGGTVRSPDTNMRFRVEDKADALTTETHSVGGDAA